MQTRPSRGGNTRHNLVVRVIHDVLCVPEFGEGLNISLEKRPHFHLFESFDFSFHRVPSWAGLPTVLRRGVAGMGVAMLAAASARGMTTAATLKLFKGGLQVFLTPTGRRGFYHTQDGYPHRFDVRCAVREGTLRHWVQRMTGGSET